MRKPHAIERMALESAAVFERMGETGAYIGALAVDAWGRPRSTQDVDVLVAKPRKELDALILAMHKAGFEYSGGASERHFSLWDVTTLTYTTRHRPWPFDMHTGDHPYLKEAWNRSRIAKVPSFGEMRVIGPEDTLIMKLLAGRAQDMVDAAGVWRNGWKLDGPYLDRWIREFQLENRLREMKVLARQE